VEKKPFYLLVMCYKLQSSFEQIITLSFYITSHVTAKRLFPNKSNPASVWEQCIKFAGT